MNWGGWKCRSGAPRLQRAPVAFLCCNARLGGETSFFWGGRGVLTNGPLHFYECSFVGGRNPKSCISVKGQILNNK